MKLCCTMRTNQMAPEGDFLNPTSGPGGSASTLTLFELNFIFTVYIETKDIFRKL